LGRARPRAGLVYQRLQTEGPAGLRADLQDGAGGGGAPIVTCFGGIDKRAPPEVPSALRTDTPTRVLERTGSRHP